MIRHTSDARELRFVTGARAYRVRTQHFTASKNNVENHIPSVYQADIKSIPRMIFSGIRVITLDPHVVTPSKKNDETTYITCIQNVIKIGIKTRAL